MTEKCLSISDSSTIFHNKKEIEIPEGKRTNAPGEVGKWFVFDAFQCCLLAFL